MADATINGEFFYIIENSGDGSACLRIFKTREAMELYSSIESVTEDYMDLSEGGRTFNQATLDQAISIDWIQNALQESKEEKHQRIAERKVI